MSDEWSLKDNLRKKIIEDINNYRKEMENFCGYDEPKIPYDDVFYFINKRFGVEE